MIDDSCSVALGKLASIFHSQLEPHEVDGGCVIVTPLTYPDMGHIELFVRRNDRGYRISDDGNTLNMLFVNGLTLEKNKGLMAEAISLACDHGVSLRHSELIVDAPADKLGEASLALLNATQAIAYLLHRRAHRGRVTFSRKLEELFLLHRTAYEANYGVRGKANLHRVRFFVNSNRNLLIEPASADTVGKAREKAKKIAYKWGDIQRAYEERRQKCPYRFVSVLDDREERRHSIWSDREALSPLEAYSDTLIRWETEQPILVALLTT